MEDEHSGRWPQWKMTTMTTLKIAFVIRSCLRIWYYWSTSQGSFPPSTHTDVRLTHQVKSVHYVQLMRVWWYKLCISDHKAGLYRVRTLQATIWSNRKCGVAQPATLWVKEYKIQLQLMYFCLCGFGGTDFQSSCTFGARFPGEKVNSKMTMNFE